MSHLDSLKGMDKFFIANEKEFQTIFDSSEPEKMPLPGDWEGKINSFQKMIVLKAIRPDKLVMAVQDYICEHLDD